MKKLILLIPFLFSFLFSFGQFATVDTLQRSGDHTTHLNFLIIGDGFTSTQQTRFFNKAKALKHFVQTFTPFKEDSTFFNWYDVRTTSIDSGTTHACSAPDCPRSGINCTQPIRSANTFYGSSFDWRGIHRFTNPGNVVIINSALSSAIPWFSGQSNNVIIEIINTPYYGGAEEGSTAVCTMDTASLRVIVHELGHAIAGLNDEYNSASGEAWNLTKTTDTSIIRWNRWLGYDGVYLYPIINGWFKPRNSPKYCLMFALPYQFCPVCRERMVYSFNYFTNLITTFTPTSSSTVTLTSGTQQAFAITTPSATSLKKTWYLDGILVSHTNVDTIKNNSIKPGNHILTVNVSDTTHYSRITMPIYNHSWNITSVNNVVTCLVPTLPVANSTSTNPLTYRLQWSPASGDSAYHIQFKSSSSNTWLNYYTTSVFQDVANLFYNTTYQFQVQGICTSNTVSPYTSLTSFTSSVPPTCSSIEQVQLTNIGYDSVTIKWNKVSGASYYNIQTYLGQVTTTDTIYKITGLKDSTAYTVQLSTFCSNNLQSGITNVSFTTRKLPILECKSPTVAIKTYNIRDKKANFIVIISPNSTTDKQYNIQWSLSGQNQWTNLPNIIYPNTYRIYSLNSNKLYDIRVRVQCNNGTSLPWNIITIKTGTGQTYFPQ